MALRRVSKALPVSYLTTDHLGSPRVLTDQLGQVISRRDFMPFGEEIASGTGGRNSAQGYSGQDNIRQKFTSYERDNETDLDFAQARMYSYGFGRFTSPDPLAASANPIRPQSWNRYSYSFNNPLRFTDPSGMIAGDFYNLDGKKIGTDGLDDKKIYIVYDETKAKEIKKTKGDYKGTVDAKITIANADVIAAIGDAVMQSNDPTSDDVKGGNHEEGVSWKTTNGTTEITAGNPGAFSDLTDLRNDTTTMSLPSNVDGRAHVHPKGKAIVETPEGNCERFFVQPPSKVDTDGALRSGTNIVVGAGNKTVYFFKPTGQNPAK